MTEYYTEIIIALIGAIPPTIMAFAAWLRAKRLDKPVNEINNAVNHRKDNQKRLIEIVDDLLINIISVSDQIDKIEDEIQDHKAWHQKEKEKEIDEKD